MAYAPFIINFSQNDDCVQLSNECHELSPNACIQEHRGNFVFQVQLIVKGVLFEIDSSEIYCALLDENPFILLYGEAVY